MSGDAGLVDPGPELIPDGTALGDFWTVGIGHACRESAQAVPPAYDAAYKAVLRRFHAGANTHRPENTGPFPSQPPAPGGRSCVSPGTAERALSVRNGPNDSGSTIDTHEPSARGLGAPATPGLAETLSAAAPVAASPAAGLLGVLGDPTFAVLLNTVRGVQSGLEKLIGKVNGMASDVTTLNDSTAEAVKPKRRRRSTVAKSGSTAKE